MANVFVVIVVLNLAHINLVFSAPGLKGNKGMSFLDVQSVQGVSICDQKGRAKDCSSYSSCDLCIACDSYCSWCAIGGMCTRFCEGADGSDCKSSDCPKKSEYKCMTMAESHSSGVDYKTEGGVDLKMNKAFKSATLRGIEDVAKVRPFSPFSYYVEEPGRQDNTQT
jgi:hypothetical protein